ncbi:DUF3786 domain-containing protein [Desulfonema magnum]|uniref:DUF3786 n=1 Tax=Desulfonema magnum TaxID=45655 RepID=A0A975GTR4_9BACT|nr:DUF3786 domain-containing protein [Desulfonema magnum]QTA93341.1 DUF3786 [Desulfonema magnum]
MPTGACGINCDVCKLKLLEVCSGCGSGKSLEARMKIEAQEKIFGASCAVLSCACMNNFEYCMRDCDSFPCDNFLMGLYPFGQGFLEMQKRRREQRPPALDHNKVRITVPPEFWDKLQQRDVNKLCNFTLADPHPSGGLVFRFLHENVRVDIGSRCLKRLNRGQWEKTDDPLLELITLVYLNHVNSLYPFGKDIVGAKDLREAHFFQGPHELKTAPLLERYGNDPDGFRKAAEYLKGRPADMADVAYMLLPFPRVPLYYLLWEGDEEFEPRISVLFDRSIEACFAGDAIWGLVSLVSLALLIGPETTKI